MIIILAGWVDRQQHDDSGPGHMIVTHEPCAFMGEAAQLAGRRRWWTPRARPVEA